MQEKLERQKIAERDDFTYEEREAVAAKSGHKCAHCGKQAYFGYGATIDHFVPLIKGGTNRDINLVMLCHECNQEKGDMIVSPEDYLPHLNKEDAKKLKGYFDSYIHSFEFVGRKNLLACDQYMVRVAPDIRSARWKKQRSKMGDKCWNIHYLKRANPDDIWKLSDYFERYTKKYRVYKDRRTVELNIEFWLRFGCVYYIEKNGEIKVIATVTVMDLDDPRMSDGVSRSLSLSIFSIYSTDYSLTLAYGIMQVIPDSIMDEQGLDQLPVRFNVVENDRLAAYLFRRNGSAGSRYNACLRHQYAIICRKDEDELPLPDEDGKLNEFFMKFGSVTEEARKWLKECNEDELSWMISEILTEYNTEEDADEKEDA